MDDPVIRGGVVLDGSGAPAARADVVAELLAADQGATFVAVSSIDEADVRTLLRSPAVSLPAAVAKMTGWCGTAGTPARSRGKSSDAARAGWPDPPLSRGGSRPSERSLSAGGS